MKVVKVLVIVAIVYAGIVTAFESLIGYFQPGDTSTLVITTTDGDGAAHDRVLSRLESAGNLYVAANHWPRAWYRQALEHPAVTVTMDGGSDDYMAVPVSPEERQRLLAEHPLGPVVKFLTGFPPRRFLRLDPA